MTRLALAVKFGKLGSPPIDFWLAAPNKVLGRRLARPITPRPREVRAKNCRRVMASGSAKGCEVRFIMGLCSFLSFPNCGIEIHYRLCHGGHRGQFNWIECRIAFPVANPH